MRNEQAVYQRGMTVITPILLGKEDALRQILARIGSDVEDNVLIPFSKCLRIHFARWVILEASKDGSDNPTVASLVLSTNYDAPREAHLQELFREGANGLHQVYSCCEGYPPTRERSRENVLNYIRSHDIGPGTLYVGTRGLSVEQIRNEERLYKELQTFLDRRTRDAAFLNEAPASIREEIQTYVRNRSDLEWALSPVPRRRKVWPYRSDALLGVLLLLILVLLFAGVIPLGLFLAGILLLGITAAVLLRYKELRDREIAPVNDSSHLENLLKNEDIRPNGKPLVQNQLSNVTNIKVGWLRRTILLGVLKFTDLSGRYKYTKGKLGSIPSIHFARWILIDKGRRLLFLSNYDGSWESYLGDFIDKAATGLTAIWSNTDGFPRARWLVNDGATDERRFKAYVRMTQTQTEVWYSAYKYLTVQDIWKNTSIREGLYEPQSEEETADWLRLF